MHPSYKGTIKGVIDSYNQNGVEWKIHKTKHYGKEHLEKRKKRRELPNNWTITDYNNLILNIMNGKDNDIHVYVLTTFTQDFFTFDNGIWIVIIGANGVMETAMKGRPKNYFINNPGYTYLGKVKDVFK